jgi:glycosyltransferase involved in cell wall biosynthesis
MSSAADVGAIIRLRRLIRECGVSLVHTHSSVDSWLGGIAAKSLGRPVVRSRHVSIPIRSALVYRLADRVITSGESVRAMVVGAGIGPERVVSISAGLDSERFHPGVSGKAVRDELGLGDAPVVGLVANIRGSKGHNVFLEAARTILAVLPQTRFLIVGDGVGFDEVGARVRQMGLDGRVSLTGFRRDIPEVMAALDVLALPSIRSEAVSQVIPQALAVGTPVVASTVGGSPEVIRDGENGRLVPPGDAAALADAILGLLREPERVRAMARAGLATVRERYTIDATMARTADLYRELVGA